MGNTIDNGNGNCEETNRCDGLFGFMAPSLPGAWTSEDCFCAATSYMYTVGSPRCVSCTSDGLECAGGCAQYEFTDGNGDYHVCLAHTEPSALPGFWMLDATEAIVRECEVTTENNGSVCLGANLCATGHFGTICGNC